jgi:excisionase family DNA binding protein
MPNDGNAASNAPSMQTEPEIIDAKELARRLGVSTDWIRRHTHEIPHLQLGRLVRFEWGGQELKAWFQRHTRASRRSDS